jgi:hypothetical protein
VTLAALRRIQSAYNFDLALPAEHAPTSTPRTELGALRCSPPQ